MSDRASCSEAELLKKSKFSKLKSKYQSLPDLVNKRVYTQ